ncbi:hypothetical protein [Clostridium kluyveri]|uniref:GAP1-N2 domain-containing protein n=1 Tax=Clostridium kluyveri TaxID=1534 RepID=UPI0022487317|nr:hypothetical protein [Clostridium kluyveri]UZQ51435.1 hypothetical protein OP486_04450 [Clostridium kluyveri]
MAIKQLFYTSCKKGLSSGMGFQTYSMSEGITDEERKEIESYCVYVPPDNLPTLPSREEIDELFPLSFSSFKLKNNKYCICSSKYIGRDYSGRYGNYFCHVLISQKPWDFYPIEIYGSPVFREFLTDEEQNREEILYLPELEEIPPGNIINFDTISQFIKKDAVNKKRKGFIQLMESVLDYSESKKRIIYCDDKNNIPFWIGAVLMCIPKKLARQFSFTTYCYNPEDLNYIICGVDKKGSKFNFKESQKSYRYHIHNFSKESNYEVRCSSSFIKLAEVGYTVSKEIFMPFIDFIGQFEYNFLDRDIDNCVNLYNIVKRGIEKSNIENIKKALSFAISYKSIRAYYELFNLLDPNLDKISTQVDLELLEIITKFLFKAGLEIENRKYTTKTYEFFFNSIHYLLVDVEEIPLQDIIDLYHRIRNLEQVSIEQFTRASLNIDRIKNIEIYVRGGKVRHAKFYFNTLARDIIIFNNKCDTKSRKVLFSMDGESKNITILFNKCLEMLIKSPEDILDILSFFKKDYEYFAKIILRAYYINNYSKRRNEVEKILAGFIIDEGNKDSQWKRKIYSQINRLDGAENFLFSIYSFELIENSDKENFFVNYCEEVFYFFQDYRDKKFSESLELYLYNKDIPLEEYKNIIDYIDKGSIINLICKNVLEKLFTDFEEKIGIEDAEKENYIIEKSVDIKNRFKIKTPLSTVELLYIGNKIQNSKEDNKVTLLKKIKIDFSNMDEYKYEGYLRWFLSSICVYLKNAGEHFKVKKILWCEVYSDIFYNTYIDTLEDIIFTKKYKDVLRAYGIEGYTVFLDFIIAVFKNMESMEKEAEEILDNRIIDILTRISERKLKEYDSYFTEKIKRLVQVKQIITKWQYIMTRVHEKNKNKSRFKFFKKQ